MNLSGAGPVASSQPCPRARELPRMTYRQLSGVYTETSFSRRIPHTRNDAQIRNRSACDLARATALVIRTRGNLEAFRLRWEVFSWAGRPPGRRYYNKRGVRSSEPPPARRGGE